MSKVPSHVDTSYNSDLETTTTELDRGLSRLVRLTTAILSGISPQSGCSGIVGQPPALKQQVYGLAQECLKRTVLVQPHLAEPCRATSGAKYLRYAPRPSFGAPEHLARLRLGRKQPQQDGRLYGCLHGLPSRNEQHPGAAQLAHFEASKG